MSDEVAVVEPPKKPRKVRQKADPAPCCGTCRFWLMDRDPAPNGLGSCRFNPPTVVGEDDGTYSTWATTSTEDWCGQYKPVEH